jgi:flagellar hook-length control protein FliK
VQLHELPGAVSSTIRFAVRDGETEARLTLDPAGLGQVRIHLRYGAGGLSAELIADSAQAAQALRETASELRRSLESQGIVVRDLDVSTSGSGRSSEGDQGRQATRPHNPFAFAGEEPEVGVDAAARRTVTGLVDVLA